MWVLEFVCGVLSVVCAWDLVDECEWEDPRMQGPHRYAKQKNHPQLHAHGLQTGLFGCCINEENNYERINNDSKTSQFDNKPAVGIDYLIRVNGCPCFSGSWCDWVNHIGIELTINGKWYDWDRKINSITAWTRVTMAPSWAVSDIIVFQIFSIPMPTRKPPPRIFFITIRICVVDEAKLIIRFRLSSNDMHNVRVLRNEAFRESNCIWTVAVDSWHWWSVWRRA